MVNREALPLIAGLFIPLFLAGVLILRMYGLDIFLILGEVDVLYYIVLFPIALGLIAALLHRKSD